MSLPKITLRDSLYIPIEYIDTEKAEEEYRHHIYDEEICKKCEYKRQRHSDECNNCELGGYVERVEFFKYKTIKGVQCMGLPIGDRTNIERRAGIDFDDFDFRDLRTDVKFDYKVKFTGKLRDYQMPLYDGYLEMKHGIIKAPPRTGKTVTSIAIAIKLGRRVAIIASQVDFLENFLEEIQQYTNLPALEEKTGKKLFGFLNKDSDYENFQIGLATYQSFISDKNGKARLKLLNRNFGTVWTDEIHKANAAEFSKFLAATTAKFKGGCTATNNRKDKREFVVENIVGPVVGETSAATLVPRIRVHITKATPRPGAYTRGPAAWVNGNKFLANHAERTKLILTAIEADLKAGRSIVMGTYFKDHVKVLVEAINRTMGKEVAFAFTGGGGKQNKLQRKEVVDKARSGEIRVVVGIRSLMQLGLNVPRWDTLYYIMPMNNAPNWQQESRRICTPDDTGVKKAPLIRMFVDPALGASLGCFKKTWQQSLELGYKPVKKALRKVEIIGVNTNAYMNGDYDDGGLFDGERGEMRAEKKRVQKEKPKIKHGVVGSLFSSIKR